MERGPAGERIATLEQRLGAITDKAEQAELLFQTARELADDNPDQAITLFDRAIEIARRLGIQRKMGDYTIRAAEAMIRTGRMDDATRFRRLVREAAELSPERREHILGSHDYVAAEIAYARGEYDDARDLFEGARRHWLIQGPPDGEQAVLMMLANIAGLQGDHNLALSYHQQSYALTEEQGDIETKVTVTYNLGWALEALGRWEDAADCFNRVLRDEAIRGRPRLIGDTYNCLGELYLHRNQLGRAIDLFRRACDELENESAQDSSRDDALNNLGLAFHRQGNLDGALEVFRRALDRSVASGDRRLQAVLYWRLAELELDRGNPGAAAQLCDESLARARATGTRNVEADALRVRGRVLAARGEADQARACFDEAVSLLADAEDSYELATARYEFGRFLLDQGQEDSAVEMLEAAGRGFRQLRVVAEAGQINRLLFRAAIGRSREEALLDALTGLNAIGLTPGEFIAEALNLMCEALRFESGVVLAQGRAAAAQGQPDAGRAQGLGPLEIVSTPTVLSWPVLSGGRPLGRVYLERRAGLQTAGGTLVFEAASNLLGDPLGRLAAGGPAGA